MKKFLCILLLSIIALPAFCDATWQSIQGNNKTIYIDTSSITNQEAQYLYWVKINNENGYKKILMKSDCQNNLTGIQKIITYDNDNKMVKTDDVNQSLTYIVPDSDAQAAYNYIYNMYQNTKIEENKKKNAVTTNKVFNTINSINNAVYDVRQIKTNTLNVLRGF